MNANDPESSIKAAYVDAKARGLPDCWTCSIDKRNRRKWTAPTGRSCDSIPKALAISVELGLLPPDFPIQSGPNKRKFKLPNALPPMTKKKLKVTKTGARRGRPPGTKNKVVVPTLVADLTKPEPSAQSTLAAASLSSSSSAAAVAASLVATKLPPKDPLDEDSYSESDEESEEEEDDGPPEPMNPEISLDGLGLNNNPQNYSPFTIKATPRTVHWDPTSANGKLIGWTVRVAAPPGSPWEWLSGRVILYDPYTHKHKIEWTMGSSSKADDSNNKANPTSWIWLRNEEHNLHISTRLVWAHVKGYAWWPALVREPNTEESSYNTKSSVQVEFFLTNEVANLRDSPEIVRPFHPFAELDPVVAKHKKKRNAKAISLATAEWYSVRHARNQAAIWYARKAWNMANLTSGSSIPYLGKQVEVFRDDVNYPYGDTLTGYVHAYSQIQKKWLVSYDLSSKNVKYEASWLNLANKQVSCRVLSSNNGTRKSMKQQKDLQELTAEDLLPFLYGFDVVEYQNTSTAKANDTEQEELDKNELALQRELSQCLQNRCHGCTGHLKQDETPLFQCSVCDASYHLGCCDPPLTKERYIQLLKEGKPLVCSRCTTCRGCYQRDICFGAHPASSTPSSLSFPTNESLDLCSMCRDAYDRNQFCPNCAHTWDDVKFQKVRKQMDSLPRSLTNPSGPGRRRKMTADNITIEDSADNSLTGRFSVDDEIPSGAKVDPAVYYPETTEWGFTEIEMLVCDSCKVWVHAGCAGITEEEYNETSEGDHPIYSKEFLCRQCCRHRCTEIITRLQTEDRMGLFAVPVTEKDAPNYHDVIKEPMDLQTMLTKAEEEEYSNYAWSRDFFELMVYNALTFNSFNTKIWNEARRFFFDCTKKVFLKIGKGAPQSRYHAAIRKIFDKAELEKKKEAERVQVDESVEKKDLVAGTMAASIVLPKLRDAPPDQPSCVPCTDVQLKPVDAFYCAWMDSCFTCGSSGAADTMLFCVDCGEAYHSFCANAPIHSMSEWAVAGWRCPNCKVCEISGEVPKDESNLIYCEMCDRAFSLHLLDPPLEEAPSGLFICGQCVDCKVCKNTSDPRGASRRHWSRDPEKCFSCGGCEGLLNSANVSACQVCNKLLHGDEPGLVSCVACGSKVRSECDPRAMRHLKLLESQTSLDSSYLCPKCYEPAAENIPKSTEVDRKDAYRLAWKAIENGEVERGEDQSMVDIYKAMTDRIEWEIRGRWKHEYVAIIEDAMKFYVKARTDEGDPRSVVQLVFNQLVNLPLWEAQRALRFVALARQYNWETNIESESIYRIVIGAKLAAAYIDVSCSVMNCEVEGHVRYPKRVEELLQAPDEAEVFTLEKDAYEQSVSRSDLDLCDVDPNQETHVDSKEDSKPAAVDAAQTHRAPLATALCGWDSKVEIGQPGEWSDPRACCLCHLCGDDDAGLSRPAPGFEDKSKWGLPVKLGRLLPMSDGQWIHTSCALWTSEVYEGEDDGMIHAVDKARTRGSQLKCFGCGRPGATVGCNKSNCSFNFHFACAKICGAVFTADKQVFCVNHKPTTGNANLLEKESFEIMKALMVAPAKKSDSDVTDEEICSRIGGLVIHSLGKVEQKKDGFHSENYITPPGYFATRIFWSCESPRKRTVYIMQIGEDDNGSVTYSITPADDTSSKITGASSDEVYSGLMDRVKKVNADSFSYDKHFSTLPMSRNSRKKAFGLNGAQFFGFGVNSIRKKLESLKGIEAVVSPLTEKSPLYQFCFYQPETDSIRDLQRRRAAAKAEMALENISGCARTEGIKAFARSGGSGRITRALVRSAEEVSTETSSGSTVTNSISDKNKGVYQAKYKKMKSVPIEQRLVARRSHIHGWGLFTKIDVPKNDPIIEYMGEVLHKPVADIREKKYEISGEGSCYMFRLDLHRIVDATMIGSMARFMNHSCSSNAYARVISVDTEYGQDKKIVVFANRDISAGEEITYDYKFPVEDGSLRCTCGAPNCIGRLN